MIGIGLECKPDISHTNFKVWDPRQTEGVGLWLPDFINRSNPNFSAG